MLLGWVGGYVETICEQGFRFVWNEGTLVFDYLNYELDFVLDGMNLRV